MYSVGDAKTNANCAGFFADLQGRNLSLVDESIQAEIFLDAMSNIMFIPGDWHTGMNYLQSIYKVFWDVLLRPLKDMLGWSRITKDVRGCYYQASRLLVYCHQQFTRYLLQDYISKNIAMYETGLKNDLANTLF